MQGLLANDEVIYWRLAPWILLNNVWLKANLLAGRVNIAHLICMKGAVGRAPRLRDSPFYNRNVFNEPFLYQKEVATQPRVK